MLEICIHIERYSHSNAFSYHQIRPNFLFCFLFIWFDQKIKIVLNFWHSLFDQNSPSLKSLIGIWVKSVCVVFRLCSIFYSLVDVGESNDRCEFKHLYSIASFCHHNILYFKKNPSSRLASMFYSQKMVYFWFQEKIQYKFSLWL